MNDARLPYHLDENLSGEIPDSPRKCHPSSLHALLGFQADVKAEPVDTGYLRLLRFNAGKVFCE